MKSATEERIWLLLDFYMPLVGLDGWECAVDIIEYQDAANTMEVVSTPAKLWFRLRVFRPGFDDLTDREQRVDVIHELRHVALSTLLDGLASNDTLEDQLCERDARILEAHLPRP